MTATRRSVLTGMASAMLISSAHARGSVHRRWRRRSSRPDLRTPEERAADDKKRQEEIMAREIARKAQSQENARSVLRFFGWSMAALAAVVTGIMMFGKDGE